MNQKHFRIEGWPTNNSLGFQIHAAHFWSVFTRWRLICIWLLNDLKFRRIFFEYFFVIMKVIILLLWSCWVLWEWSLRLFFMYDYLREQYLLWLAFARGWNFNVTIFYFLLRSKGFDTQTMLFSENIKLFFVRGLLFQRFISFGSQGFGFGFLSLNALSMIHVV